MAQGFQALARKFMVSFKTPLNHAKVDRQQNQRAQPVKYNQKNQPALPGVGCYSCLAHFLKYPPYLALILKAIGVPTIA
jgi:hypothetical protein